MQNSCVHSKWCKGYGLRAQREHNTEHNRNRTQHIQCITRHLPHLYVETKRKAIEASKREGKLKLVLTYIRHVCYNVNPVNRR